MNSRSTLLFLSSGYNLDNMITKKEVLAVIKDMPKYSALGPVVVSHHEAWQIIKNGVITAPLKLLISDGWGLGNLSKAFITLIQNSFR